MREIVEVAAPQMGMGPTPAVDLKPRGLQEQAVQPT
jgi:hypothetical protein